MNKLFLKEGGHIFGRAGRKPKYIITKLEEGAGEDRYPAILAAGELVIPRRLAKSVSNFLKKRKKRIPTVYV
jgi:hypothetical protein